MVSAAPAAVASGAGGRPLPTPEALAALKAGLVARGLTTTVGGLSVQRGVPLADAIANARQQIANAHTLGQKFALTLGLFQEADYIQFTKVLADAAAFGQERGVKVVIKHHHGLNNTAGELVGWLKQVNHTNFGIFYDPGNVVYYTGKDPVAQLEVVGPYVVGVVAKDCTEPQFQERKAGDPGFGTKPPDSGGNEVMIQLGTGKVNFPAFFKRLKELGFDGPVMLEGSAVGATIEETVANARANREFLERTLAPS
jgi:sugar phosphate isomerase/epimerase